MAQTVEFMDSAGYMVTVDANTIKHVARPKGGYSGEITLTTGAKWGFGGNRTAQMDYYERALFAFKQATKERQEQGS